MSKNKSTEKNRKQINDTIANKSYIKDFMASRNPNSSKGKYNDPLMSQIQTDFQSLDYEDLKNIYKHNRIAANLVDIPAEDCVREWIALESENEDAATTILSKLNDLKAKSSFEKIVEYERLTGDGFISIGASQNDEVILDEPIDKNSLSNISYIHPFSSYYMTDMEINESPMSPEFGDFEMYILRATSNLAQRRVHPSRILHMQSRTVEDEKKGIPIYLSCYDALTILDSTAWSLGQIVYSAVFKVLKSPDIDITNRDEVEQLTELLERDFNTRTLALIGKDDELTHEGPGGSLPNLQHLIDFVWDYLAGCARMPKSHLLGQQQGTITGGQYDSLNYYMRIAGIQESFLRPLIEELIDLIIHCDEVDVSEDLDYSLKFNSLWRLDKKTDAEIRKLQHEIYGMQYNMGMVTSEELREKEYNNKSIVDELDLTEEDLKELGLDTQDIDDLASKVHEKYKQSQE